MSTVLKTIDVAVPAMTAYEQWTQFEDFPRFMDGVDRVQQIDDTHLHWCATIQGKTEEWDAEITEQLPGKRIAWRSTSGAENSGVVTFHHLSDERSRVALQFDYEPQTWTERLGALFGVVDGKVEDALQHFKQFIEGRRVPTGAWLGEVRRPEDPPSCAAGADSQGEHKAGEDNGKRYNRAAETFAGTDESEDAAREAERALDGPEGDELRRAERVGHERVSRTD